MNERKVLVRQDSSAQAVGQSWGERFTYDAVGWVGGILALTALSDFALALYPWGFGSAEWELATIGAVVQGLPLFSIGLAAVWISAGGTGRRLVMLGVVSCLLVGITLLAASLIVFLTDVPPAVRATQGVARIGIYKLVARTLFMGLLFAAAYLAAAVTGLKRTKKT